MKMLQNLYTGDFYKVLAEVFSDCNVKLLDDGSRYAVVIDWTENDQDEAYAKFYPYTNYVTKQEAYKHAHVEFFLELDEALKP